MAICFVGSDDGSLDTVSDYTTANRATYDRIASRCVENQRQHASGNASTFSTLEDAFLSTLPRGGLVVNMGCGPRIDSTNYFV